MGLGKAALLLTLGGLAPLGAQGADPARARVLVPPTSVRRPEDAGVRMRTNHLILMGPAAGQGQVSGITPAQMRSFYGMPAAGHDVIVLVDAYDYPTALADFNTFSNQFGLPVEPSSNATASTNQVFQVVYQGGQQPAGNAGWNQEAALDIEWAHAMAPNAKIVLVEAADDSDASLFSAVDTAAAFNGATEVSLSWGGDEFSGEAWLDSHFQVNGPVFVASAGDNGGIVLYPSCSQYVMAVGGTTVTTNGSGVWTGETAWSDGGGGNSAYIAQPAWQSGVGMAGANRGVPDLAADADPVSGVAVYDSDGGWMVFGGTSLAAPCMAGMVNASGTTFANTTQLLTNLYGNALETPAILRDITSGSNGFPATVGWDYATGVGVPNGPGSFSPVVLEASILAPATRETVTSGSQVSFSGSATDTAGGATLSYSWAFGDGTGASGATPASHLFTNPGTATVTYGVVLTASDGHGTTATFKLPIAVNPDALSAGITAPAAGATAVTGTPVTFTGSAADSNAAATLAYAWAFGDGATGTGATASHTYALSGSTQAQEAVVLTVTDSAGVKATASETLAVLPVISAAITAPAGNVTVNPGVAVSFAATATDNTGATLAYAWTFGDGGSATGPSASHAYGNTTGAPVTLTATLTVTDSNNVSVTATRAVTVQPVLSAAITAPAANVTVTTGASVAFTAAATDLTTGATLSYAWAFGDLTTGSGPSVNHTFTVSGTTPAVDTVVLTVMDSNGVSVTASRNVTVNPLNTVTAAITAPGAGVTQYAGVPVAFTGTGADSSASASLTYAWTFGDGGSASGASVSHTYANAGTTPVTFTAGLTVTDNTGVTATASRVVTVAPQNTVTAVIAAPGSAVTVSSGTSVSFTGSASDSSSSATLAYNWAFGDGATANGPSASHVFVNAGAAAVTDAVVLTVTDNSGASATATVTVTVNPVDRITAAIPSPGAAVTVATGVPVAFTGSGTDSAASAPLSYAWAFGDGGTAAGASASHTYTNLGASPVVYTAVLTVSDGTGAAATASCAVTVTGVTIAVPATSVGLLTGASATFTATLTGTADEAVLWGATGGTLTPGTPSTSATFTTATAGTYFLTATSAFDPSQTAVFTVAVHSAELTGDSAVSGLDVLELVGLLGTHDAAADLNGDGIVNAADLTMLLNLLGW